MDHAQHWVQYHTLITTTPLLSAIQSIIPHCAQIFARIINQRPFYASAVQKSIPISKDFMQKVGKMTDILMRKTYGVSS